MSPLRPLRALLPGDAALLALAAAALAFAIRAAGSDFGLPYNWHPDEGAVINTAVVMLKTGDLNPHYFNYPSLPAYLHLVGVILSYFSLAGKGPAPEIASIVTGIDSDAVSIVGVPAMWANARLLGCLLGAATVALVSLAGSRLGGLAVGGLAGLILALAPEHTVHSRYITVDGPACLAVAATLLASVALYRENARRHYVLAAVAAGAAIACKYNAALVVLAPLTAWWIQTERRDERFWWGVSLVPGAVLAFFVFCPYAFLDLTLAVSQAGAELTHYSFRGHGEYTVEPWGPHFVALTGFLATHGFGAWLLLLPFGVYGLARSDLRGAVVLLAFPLVFLVFSVRMKVFFGRNLMAFYPALAILAAFGAVTLWNLLRDRPRSVRVVAAIALLATLLQPTWLTLRATAKLASVQDSRVLLAEWVVATADPSMIVALPRELGLRPDTFGEVKTLTLPLEDGPAAWHRAGATHVVGSHKLVHPGLRRMAYDKDDIARWNEMFAALPPVKGFGSAGFPPGRNARSPAVGLYALGGDVPEAVEPVDSDPPAGANAGAWLVTPKAARGTTVTLDGDRATIRHTDRQQKSRVCVVGPATEAAVTVTGRWRRTGVSAEKEGGAIALVRLIGDTPPPKIVKIASVATDAEWEEFMGTAGPRAGTKRVEACVDLRDAVGTIEVESLSIR